MHLYCSLAVDVPWIVALTTQNLVVHRDMRPHKPSRHRAISISVQEATPPWTIVENTVIGAVLGFAASESRELQAAVGLWPAERSQRI